MVSGDQRCWERSETRLQGCESPQEPRGLLGAWDLRGELQEQVQVRLPTPDDDYCRMVSQYVVFAPKGPEHPVVWSN